MTNFQNWNIAYAVHTNENNVLFKNGKSGHWDPANKWVTFLFVFEDWDQILFFFTFTSIPERYKCISTVPDRYKTKKILLLVLRYLHIIYLWLNVLTCKMEVIKLCLLWGLNKIIHVNFLAQCLEHSKVLLTINYLRISFIYGWVS